MCSKSYLLNPCQPKKWAKRYRLMDSACQICIPKGYIITPTTRDMTVRETYTQSIVRSNQVFLVCWSHKTDELNCKQNVPMCSNVWSGLSHVFSWKFVCYSDSDDTLSNMIVLWSFSFKSVFRKMEWQWEPPKNNPEKRVEKGQVVQPNGTSWDKLEYVGQVEQEEGGLQSDLSGTSGTRRRGSSHLRGTSGTRTRSLSTWTTCPKWDYKAVQDSFFPSATRQHWISHNLSDSRIPQIWAKSKQLWKRVNLTEKSYVPRNNHSNLNESFGINPPRGGCILYAVLTALFKFSTVEACEGVW